MTPLVHTAQAGQRLVAASIVLALAALLAVEAGQWRGGSVRDGAATFAPSRRRHRRHRSRRGARRRSRRRSRSRARARSRGEAEARPGLGGQGSGRRSCRRKVALLVEKGVCAYEEAAAAVRAAVKGGCPVVRSWMVPAGKAAQEVSTFHPTVVVAVGPKAAAVAKGMGVPTVTVYERWAAGRRGEPGSRGSVVEFPSVPDLREVLEALGRVLSGPRTVWYLGRSAAVSGKVGAFQVRSIRGRDAAQVVSRVPKAGIQRGDLVLLAPDPGLFPPVVLRFLVALQGVSGCLVVGFSRRHAAFGAALAVGWSPSDLGGAAAAAAVALAEGRRVSGPRRFLSRVRVWYNSIVARRLPLPRRVSGVTAVSGVEAGCRLPGD